MQIAEGLNRIRNLSGLNAKKQILKRISNQNMLKLILYQAYSPFINYGYSRVITGLEPGPTILEDGAWQEPLHAILKTNSRYDKEVIIKRLLSRLKKPDQLIMASLIAKKLKIGLGVKSINQVYPNLIPAFDVMLAKSYKDHADKVNSEWLMSIKYDGLRGVSLIDPKSNKRHIFSRKGLTLPGLKHLYEELQNCALPLDGELFVPGMTFQQASGLIRSGKASRVNYLVFDTSIPEAPLTDRLDILEEELRECQYVKVVKHKPIGSASNLFDTYSRVIKAGYEGLMLKDPKALYTNTRSDRWLKLKPVHDIDLRIVAFEEGEGKYTDSLGAIVCEYKNSLVKVGTGFSDSERHDIWQNQDKYLHKVAEIKYLEKTPTGSLRHPVFVRFRFDK
jgi:DNA ligase-1